jgi:anti-sigma factor RsiW
MGNERHLSEEILNAHLDGELDASEHDRVVAHLSTCTTCLTELEALQELFAALDELGMSSEPTPDLAPTVLARVRPRHRAIKLRWIVPVLQGAAALALFSWGWRPLASYWTAVVNALPMQAAAETWSRTIEWGMAQWTIINASPNTAWSDTQSWIAQLAPATGLGPSWPQLAAVSAVLATLWLACNIALVRRSLLNGHKTRN